MPFERLIYRLNAVERIFERKEIIDEISEILRGGETIENYPEDSPYSTYLVLGFLKNRPVHIVAADNKDAKETVVITAYEPDKRKWQEDFKRRRE